MDEWMMIDGWMNGRWLDGRWMMFSVEVLLFFWHGVKGQPDSGWLTDTPFAVTLFVPGGGKPERRNDGIKVNGVSAALHGHSVITPPLSQTPNPSPTLNAPAT